MKCAMCRCELGWFTYCNVTGCPTPGPAQLSIFLDGSRVLEPVAATGRPDDPLPVRRTGSNFSHITLPKKH